KMSGVRAIFHRENIGKIFRSVQGTGFEGITDERRPPFEDDIVRYYGQYVALAVADTFEAAKAAADAVRVTYAKEKPNVDTDLKADDEPDERSRLPRPLPMRCASPTQRRSLTLIRTSKPTTNRMSLRLHSPRLRVCKASAASPRALLRARPSSSTKPMSPPPRRTTP